MIESIFSLRRVISISILVLTLWVLGLIQFTNKIPRYVNDQETPTEAAIVLTGGSERLDSALKLLEKGVVDKLFISGVGKGATLPKMLDLLQGEKSIPEELQEKIELGYTAKDTTGNALEAAQWITENSIESVRLVTAHYHMQRSFLELQQQAANANIIKNPVFPKNVKLQKWWQHQGTRSLLISEYNKYLLALFISKISSLRS
jgi:uncharacterized SAM-binding protein YcdF (DUF218 family)